MVVSLFQVHKAHLGWLGKVQFATRHPCKGIEVVQYSMTRIKISLLLLKLKFD